MTLFNTQDGSRVLARATLTGAAALVAAAAAVAMLPGAALADAHEPAVCAVEDPAADVTDEIATELYDCLIGNMRAQLATLDAGGEITGPSWLLSDRAEARAFLDYESVTTAPYTSATHGNRYVVNLADPVAMPLYSQFEEGVPMTVGGILAKPSFVINAEGVARLGPLFLMERAEDGAFPDMGDWIYTAIMPNGNMMGRTGEHNSNGMQFCADCHLGIGMDTDSMTYLPEEYRVSN